MTDPRPLAERVREIAREAAHHVHAIEMTGRPTANLKRDLATLHEAADELERISRER